MYFPTWIDLKGQDAVPETVHHVVSIPSAVIRSDICLYQKLSITWWVYRQLSSGRISVYTRNCPSRGEYTVRCRQVWYLSIQSEPDSSVLQSEVPETRSWRMCIQSTLDILKSRGHPEFFIIPRVQCNQC
jgi:hypothetical protein